MGIMGQLGALRAIAVLCLCLGDFCHEAVAISVRRHSMANSTGGMDPDMTTWSMGMPNWQDGASPAYAGSPEQLDLGGPFFAGSSEGYGPQASYYAGVGSYPPSGADAYPPGGAAPYASYPADPYEVPGASKKAVTEGEGQAGSQWPFMPMMIPPLLPLMIPPLVPSGPIMSGIGALMLAAPLLEERRGRRRHERMLPPLPETGGPLSSLTSQPEYPPQVQMAPPPLMAPPPPMPGLDPSRSPGTGVLKRLLQSLTPAGTGKLPSLPLLQSRPPRGDPFVPTRAATRRARCGLAREADLYRPVDEVLRLAGGVDGYCYFQLKAPWLVSSPHHDYATHAKLAEEEMQTSMNTCGSWRGDSKGRELTYVIGRERVRTHMDCEYYAYDDLYAYAMGFLKGQGLPGKMMNNYEGWTKLAYAECKRIHDVYKFHPNELSIKAYMSRIMPLKFKVDCTIKGGYDCQQVTRRDFKLHGYMKCLLGVNHFADDMAFGYQRACLLPDGQTIAHASECDRAIEIQ